MPSGAVIEDQMALDNIPRFACPFSSEISCESHTAISSTVDDMAVCDSQLISELKGQAKRGILSKAIWSSMTAPEGIRAQNGCGHATTVVDTRLSCYSPKRPRF